MTRLQSPLDRSHGQGSVCRDRVREVGGGLNDRLSRREPVDQPQPERVLRCNPPPGKEQIAGRAAADDAWQPQRAARAGEDANLHLRKAECGILGGDTEIAGDGQLGAARKSEPTHGGDGRHRQGRQRFGGGFDRRRVRGSLVRREHPPLLEIRAGTKGALAGSGYDDRPDILSLGQGVAARQQLRRKLPANGVQGLGSIQRQRGDVTFAVDSQQD